MMGLFTGGCLGFNLTYDAEYAVRNDSGQTLDEATVRIGTEHMFNHGVLVLNAIKSYSGPMPLHSENQVAISWQDATGRVYEAVLNVSRKTLTDKRICLFMIDPTMHVKQGWWLRDTD